MLELEGLPIQALADDERLVRGEFRPDGVQREWCDPDVLRLLGSVVEAAHEHGAWVGVCGESAADHLERGRAGPAHVAAALGAPPVFDLVREVVYRGSADAPLEIPAGAVVVPGARNIRAGWGAAEGLSLQTPVIVKYRDARTDTRTELEQWIR